LRNIALNLMYNGTTYHGWQVQKSEPTVAEALESALSSVLKHRVKVTGCGRTDAGVHALRYCANFKTESRIPTDRIPLALSGALGKDIVVRDAVEAPEDFNAILSCEKKEYTYIIYNSRIGNPFFSDRAYFYPVPLDVEKMRQAARHLVGERDFSALRSTGSVTKTAVRTLYRCDIRQSGEIIKIKMCADGFLYNMARAISGTLLYVSEGKIAPDEVPDILLSRDRRLAGPTLPPQGLYLTRLWYGGPVGEMMAR
jgi:tRNA pseudouridine38-40 synthase